MSEGPRSGRQMVEDVLPDDFDWEELVRAYPLTSLALAAVGGFLLARARGPEIVSALSDYLTDKLSRSLNEVLGNRVV